tara:strand:+ start:692 stop:3025 length:2334 start_codon:yes stop_codon:yes gene_type:complete
MPVHRNRVIYQSEALFISPDSTGYHFTGAHGEVTAADNSKHSAHWGLSTPPLDNNQVIGSVKNEAGQAAGWNCTDGVAAWPEWDPEGKSGKKATYGGGGSMDNLTREVVFTSTLVGTAGDGDFTTAGATDLNAQATAADIGVDDHGSLLPDPGQTFTLAGGVDPVANVNATIQKQGVDFTAVAAGTAGDGININFTAGAAGAVGVTEDVGANTVAVTFEDGVTTFGDLDFTAITLITVALGAAGATLVNDTGVVTAGGVDEVVEVKSSVTATVGFEVLPGVATLIAKERGTAGNVKLPPGDDAKTLFDLVTEHNNAQTSDASKVEFPSQAQEDAAKLEVVNTGVEIELTGGEKAYAQAHGTIIKQLQRVQSANYGFTVNRQDINQFGHASRLDSIVIESPTVNLDFSYYLLDGLNERLLEFVTDGTTNTLSGLLTPELYQAGNNFFILTAPEARDAVKGDVSLNEAGKETDKSVIALGNGYITDYSVDISVGSIPTASVTVEGMNIRSDFGTTGNDVPAVDMKNGSRISDAWDRGEDGTDPRDCKDGGCTGLYSLPAAVSGYTGCATDGSIGSIAALRPGDVLVDLSSKSLISKSVAGNSDTPVIGSAHVQSASLSLPLGRTTLQRLGSVFGFSKAIDLPLSTSMSFSALVADIKEGNMMDLLCDCEEFDIGITIFKPECAGCTVKDVNDPDKIAMRFTMKGARLESENFSSTIGDNKSVDLTFNTQIGSSDDMRNGLYIYGSESVLSANNGLPPAWTGLNGSTIDAIDGYLFGYRA